MIPRATRPRIVGAFMLVAKTKKGMRRMHGARTFVRLVLRMARPVVLQGEDFVRQIVRIRRLAD